MGPNWAQFWAQFMTPFCPRCLSIYCLCLRRPPHPSNHRSRRDEGEAPGGSRRPPRVLELPRRWLRPCPSRHGWPCVVKPWWSSGAATWIRQVVCTFNIRWCNHILSYFDLLRVMLIHMYSYHMPLVGLDRIMVISLVLQTHHSSART
jgi:hypothetical protein